MCRGPSEVAHLREGVFDQIVQRLIQGHLGTGRFDWERLAGHEVVGLGKHVCEQRRETFPPLPVVFGQITVDTFGGGGQRAVVLGPEIFVRLQIRPQFPPQTLLVVEPDQDLAPLPAYCPGGIADPRIPRTRRPAA